MLSAHHLLPLMHICMYILGDLCIYTVTDVTNWNIIRVPLPSSGTPPSPWLTTFFIDLHLPFVIICDNYG